MVFIKFSVATAASPVLHYFPSHLAFIFFFLDLVIVFFRFFMICTFFFDYPCDWHGLHVFRDIT